MPKVQERKLLENEVAVDLRKYCSEKGEALFSSEVDRIIETMQRYMSDPGATIKTKVWLRSSPLYAVLHISSRHSESELIKFARTAVSVTPRLRTTGKAS